MISWSGWESNGCTCVRSHIAPSPFDRKHIFRVHLPSYVLKPQAPICVLPRANLILVDLALLRSLIFPFLIPEETQELPSPPHWSSLSSNFNRSARLKLSLPFTVAGFRPHPVGLHRTTTPHRRKQPGTMVYGNTSKTPTTQPNITLPSKYVPISHSTNPLGAPSPLTF